ncbi:CPBP family intramembrane glutamic endopeptidase [Mycobacterium gastri]|uniref:Abortive infection protein n=1 Tax=Mycobacterium gastri TaxID=1777 RepID=A0A1X1VSP8_MYCGS|nr:CPBP family intramembrane glutamic endopeptidase [Mycobacterium gastri]ORV72092.1 abortive infection protein [Mycobacterium gastri]
MSQSTAPRPSAIRDLRRAMTNVAVPHHESPRVVLRRRIVVCVVLLIGAAVLGLSMSRRPGDSTFHWLTLALAVVWAVGALASGPLHLGGICWRGRNQRPVITGTTVGLVLGGVFVLGGLVTREIPAMSDLTVRVLRFAEHGSVLVVLIIVINGVAEEMFFRGALYTALGRFYPALLSTLVYVAAIMATGNPMLGFAAVILGMVCAWERRFTGGVLAPILTHVVWGLIMVLALPPLFGV